MFRNEEIDTRRSLFLLISIRIACSLHGVHPIESVVHPYKRTTIYVYHVWLYTSDLGDKNRMACFFRYISHPHLISSLADKRLLHTHAR